MGYDGNTDISQVRHVRKTHDGMVVITALSRERVSEVSSCGGCGHVRHVQSTRVGSCQCSWVRGRVHGVYDKRVSFKLHGDACWRGNRVQLVAVQELLRAVTFSSRAAAGSSAM